MPERRILAFEQRLLEVGDSHRFQKVLAIATAVVPGDGSRSLRPERPPRLARRRSVGWIGIQRLKGPYLPDFWECAFYRLNETTAAHDDLHIEKFYGTRTWEFDDSTFCVVTRPRTVSSSSRASSSTESLDDEE